MITRRPFQNQALVVHEVAAHRFCKILRRHDLAHYTLDRAYCPPY